MFLTAIEIMLQNIRSEREGLWTAHLISVSAMLPCPFTTHRENYSRLVPVCILDMLSLPSDIKEAFESGQFAIGQKPGAFNGIWSDMVVGKTLIKISKGTRGIVGITRQKSSFWRWSLTRHVLADFCSALRSRSGASSKDEAKMAAMKRGEEHV